MEAGQPVREVAGRISAYMTGEGQTTPPRYLALRPEAQSHPFRFSKRTSISV